MSKPRSELISVIIPIYNSESYLRRCIESILKQTYKRIEIILVNDGSTDHCGEICDEYASKYEHIEVIHKENGGIGDARNTGLEKARGKYVAFVDSDDWIDVTYFEYLYNLLIEEDADIAVCDYAKTKNEKINARTKKIEKFSKTGKEGLSLIYGTYYIQIITPWGKLYKKSLFKNVRYPVGKIHDDEFTTYKLISNAKRIVVSNKKLYFYWLHDASSMEKTKFSLKSRMESIEFLSERIHFFENINESILRDKTIKECFFYYEKVNDNLINNLSEGEKKSFKKDFYQFKETLDESNQSLKFKVYYKFYYFNPVIAKFIYGLLITIKSKFTEKK